MRGQHHPDFLPTDEQAEVLIPDQIQKQDVMGIIVRNEKQARREVARLGLIGRTAPPIVIVPECYAPGELSRILRSGQLPMEKEHRTGGANAE